MSVELVLRFIGGILAGIGGWSLAVGLPQLSSPSYLSYLFLFTVSATSFGIAFLLTPYVTTRPFFWTLNRITHTPVSDIMAASVGLVMGLLLGVLLTFPLTQLPSPLGEYLPIVVSLALGYLGMTTLSAHKKEVFNLIGLPRDIGSRKGAVDHTKVIVDTSAIIDGRIADICATGFLSGTLVVPRFVLMELQHIADSSDSLRRNRGRRGLDVLNKLQKDAQVPLEIAEGDPDTTLTVDAKLVRMARTAGCAIITNDYNLNRVAGIQGVKVLNVNELANAVKSVVLPGEEMTVRIIHDGKEYGQGVGYLEDGTMIVVENAKRYQNANLDIVVTRVLQTAAGRMIFAQPRAAQNGQG
jgi:uncharacterized protein YacL